MGWTSENIIDTSQSAIRRKCDEMFCEGYTVLKSVMVGSTYYAAVRTPKGTVVGAVTLTSIDNSDYFNFSHKEMEESMGPSASKCPESILKLLTETESEYASAWRKRCREYNRKKSILKSLPVDTEIIVNGDTYIKSVYRGRKAWICWDKYWKIPETRIAEIGFEVV